MLMTHILRNKIVIDGPIIFRANITLFLVLMISQFWGYHGLSNANGENICVVVLYMYAGS